MHNKSIINKNNINEMLPFLCCPIDGSTLALQNGELVSEKGRHYKIDANGIPMFAEEFCSEDAIVQRQHYDHVSTAYLNNLEYPHTQEYMDYLDDILRKAVGLGPLGVTAEICCGGGEAFNLFAKQMKLGVGVDVSLNMLTAAHNKISSDTLSLIQGDATRLPLKSNSIDTIIMLGGIHHVPDRHALFSQLSRVLKPGGRFIWREPLSDFWLWRFLRAIIYRVSPMLDNETERPLLFSETEPLLRASGFKLNSWSTCGFIGFCFFMNSDVLFFNRFLRFIPGIRIISRMAAKFDSNILKIPGLRRAGLQVVGIAVN
tara:strand:- start:9083 stop:10030 length:948 start_codon:yes stop_codon:yes gene_type:complete